MTVSTLADTPPANASRSLPPRVRKSLLTLHIATAAGLIGADLVLLVLAINGTRGSDPETVYPAMELLGAWVLAPLAVLALATGVTQAALTRWGLFRHWWVSAKLATTSVLTVLVLAVLVPALDEAAQAALGPSAADILTDARRTLFVIVPSITVTLLVIMVGLGVYKPGSRTKRQATT